MKYSKISGTFLNFQTGQRLETGVSYSSQEMKLEIRRIVIRTYDKNKTIETILNLDGPGLLNFESKSDNPAIPVIKGRYFNNEYEECILKSSLPGNNLDISGVVTKIGQLHGISTKTLTEASSGKITGVMQEQVELISESEFKIAIKTLK